ncbi:aldo/keto reductase [Mycolicibacterium sp. S2-37]|uniref:aldo/keto reductase n=1 Tax=Mycolicibacterium sp. S2-37 TaxID=2810297 RepID=UPI001A94EDF5|nr:aldo/keto reductase [Mycolicibacterium sp. S2-37]MBO0676496.1 aldo/keto reductase [Mycolicibacterium sp. S2-37]
MRYRYLGRSGLRVSTLSLGTGNFGAGWGHGATPAEAQAMYDRYRVAGGNFIDTSSNYQLGDAEVYLSDMIASHRDEVVLATKYSTGTAIDSGLQMTGNGRKSMIQSLEASLRRLKTDRVDLLWAHAPDHATPIEEIMRAFDDLVRSGKVLYVGLSSFPAWRVATGATIAAMRGWAPVVAIQTEYSLVERTAERDLLPMAEGFGLGVLGYSPLGGGMLTGKYRRGERGRAQSSLSQFLHHEEDGNKAGILDTVEAIARETDGTPEEVAISWSMAKGVIPIIGPRTVDQLSTNLAAAQLLLSSAQVGELDAASAIRLGYPHSMKTDQGAIHAVTGGKAALLDTPARSIP